MHAVILAHDLTHNKYDGVQVFRPHVLGWILTSQEALCQRCRVIEATTYATAAAGPEGRMPEDGTCLLCFSSSQI